MHTHVRTPNACHRHHPNPTPRHPTRQLLLALRLLPQPIRLGRQPRLLGQPAWQIKDARRAASLRLAWAAGASLPGPSTARLSGNPAAAGHYFDEVAKTCTEQNQRGGQVGAHQRRCSSSRRRASSAWRRRSASSALRFSSASCAGSHSTARRACEGMLPDESCSRWLNGAQIKSLPRRPPPRAMLLPLPRAGRWQQVMRGCSHTISLSEKPRGDLTSPPPHPCHPPNQTPRQSPASRRPSLPLAHLLLPAPRLKGRRLLSTHRRQGGCRHHRAACAACEAGDEA